MKGIYPFSFREYLRVKNVELREDLEYLTEERVKIMKYLARYVEDGGFPEYLKYREREILHRLFRDIIFRDILVRKKFTV
ncbi:MAG: ATP-binding protein [Methanophagales archaeon]|nr:ATP-binding protein [Methanophagales archaeon]